MTVLLWVLARRTSWAVIRSQSSTIASLSVLLVFTTVAVLAGVTPLLLPDIGVTAAIVLAARAAGTALSWSEGALEFGWSVLAAVVLGLLIGRLAAIFTDHVDSVEARNALTWVLPFAIYIGAEEIGASGVIAVVTAAVELTSRASIGAEDRLSGHAFWGTVEMLFTGVAFGLIGLNVRRAFEEVGSELWRVVGIGAALALAAIAVRFTWLLFSYRANRRRARRTGSAGLRAPLRLQEVLLMTWSGMRGLVTLALVLSIPDNVFPFHHEITVIALLVLLLTMVIPGLSLPWLVRRLDLDQGPDAAGDQAREKLVTRARRTAVTHLMEKAALPEEQVESIRSWVSQEMAADEEHVNNTRQLRETAHRARVDFPHAAQEELLQVRREPWINPAYVDEVLATVDRMLLAARR